MRLLLVSLLALVVPAVQAGVKEGLAAKRRGDFGAAYREFLPLANSGDVKAMTTLGLLLHQGGAGLPQNYVEAMTWYLRALEHGDGDGYNNIGVMFRDGLGVKKNRSIAYALFLIVHMRGLGSEATVSRANENLRREVAEATPAEIEAAFCMSEQFVLAYVKARGAENAIPAEARRTQHQKLRDKDWWSSHERDALPTCSGPAV